MARAGALSHIIGGVTPRGRGDRRPGSAPQIQMVLEHNRVGLQSEPPVSLQSEPPVSHRAPERVIRPLGRLLPPEPDLLPYSQEETHIPQAD
ncbi:Ribosomal RNA small subunit methyltransferase J, partial [Dissostichus eleginoides]